MEGLKPCKFCGADSKDFYHSARAAAYGARIHYPITQAELALYDNSESGLKAENAQDAIDELSAALDETRLRNGSGAPTTSTKGAVGQTYTDTDTGTVYTCVGVKTEEGVTTYTWEATGGPGSGGGSLKLDSIATTTV